MSWWRIRSRWAAITRRSRLEREMDAELRFHLECRAADLERGGLRPEEARRRARLEFGSVEAKKEECRESLGLRLWDELGADLRYGLRGLRRDPAFTLVAVLTLGLGIGANTAIFTLVRAVLISPLPVARPSELYSFGDTSICCDTTDVQENFALYSYPLYRDVRAQAREFSEVAAFQSWLPSLSVRRPGKTGLAEAHHGQFVSGNYFSMFGVGAFAGRTLTATDDEPSAPPVAVMSFRAWKQRFGGDPSVIGAAFTLNGSSVTVVGVAAPDFFGDTLRSDPPAFWLPLALEPALERDNPLLNQAGEFWLYVIGRLRAEGHPAQVEARLGPEIRRWLTEHTTLRRRDVEKVRVQVLPAGQGAGTLRKTYGDGLRLLTAVTGLVLLMACGNIANLLLARSDAERLQTSLRIALGASRARIVRQMLTGGLLLAALGGAAGILLAFAATRALIWLAFRGAEYVPIDATPSPPVIALALLTALVTGVFFTLAPAWLASGTHPADAMRGGGRATRDRSLLPQRALIGAQAAMSLVLLVGAGLLGQSLRNLQNQDFGFETQGRLIVRLNPALAGYTPERLPALYRTLKYRFSHLPGVRRASLALHSPLDGWNWNAQVYVAGRAPMAIAEDEVADYDFVSPDYFDVIGTRILRGRPITEGDRPGGRHVCVVNQTFAHKFFGQADPIGGHLGLNGVAHSGDYEVVGVVEDTKYRNPGAPAEPMVFMPLLQLVEYEQPTQNAYQTWSNYIDGVQLQVAGTPPAFEGAIRRTLSEIDPGLTVLRLTTLDGQVSGNFNSPRLVAQLTTLYGLVALALASVGLYGVASYTVARRTSEIGVRIALGAQRQALMAMVLRGTMRPIGLGLAIGLPAVVAAGRAISAQLYGVRSHDPVILLGAVAALGLAAVSAALVPARRAASIDPIRALRTD